MTSEYELPPLPDPVTYAHFTDDGMIRIWSNERTNLQAVTDAIGKQPSALISLEQAEAYAIAAIEADRNRRGESVARLVALYDSAKNKYRAECSAYYEGQADAYDMAIQIVESEAPQPAEPVDVDHGETRVNIELEAETGSDLGGVVDHGEAEPVKVPSDAESWLEEAIDEVVVAALEEGMCGRAMGDTPLTDSAKAGAMQRIRALLARYGKNLGRGKTRMDSGFQAQEAAEIGQVYVDGEGRE